MNLNDLKNFFGLHEKSFVPIVGIGTVAPSGLLHVAGGDMILGPLSASTGAAFAIREASANGTDAVSLRVPNALAASYTLTLPAATGASGQFLATDASGNLSWATNPGGTMGWVQGGNSFGVTGTLGTNDAQALAIRTAGTTRMTINAGGSIGIGTTDSNATLTIAKGGGTGANAPTTISLENNYLQIGAEEYYTGSYRLIGFGYTASGATYSSSYIGSQERGFGGAGATDLIFGTRALNSDIEPTERMRITAEGGIGVGTTTPLSQLHVRQATASSGTKFYPLMIQSASTDEPSSAIIKFATFNAGSDGVSAYIGAERKAGGSGSAHLVFGTGADGASVGSEVERMRIDQGGNVGIGETDPDERLHVNGNVLATAYLYSSDVRLKKDFVLLDHSLEKLLELEPVTYRWIHPQNPEADREQIGLKAQQVRDVYPQAVREDDKGFLRLDYPALIAPVIKAIQELYYELVGVKRSIASKAEQTDVDALKADNEAKDREIRQLKQENEAIKGWICAKDPNAELCR